MALGFEHGGGAVRQLLLSRENAKLPPRTELVLAGSDMQAIVRPCPGLRNTRLQGRLFQQHKQLLGRVEALPRVAAG